MNKSYFSQSFFLIDWRHKRLKNTIDLLLWRTLGRWFMKTLKKNIHFITNTSMYKVIDNLKFYFAHIVKVCFVFKKQLLCLYSSVY